MLGRPEQWFDPTAFVLQPAGHLGNTGRGDFIGPDLDARPGARQAQPLGAGSGSRASVELRIEVFNLLNRANFGIPNLMAFAGRADGEPPLPTFGRIRSTVTSSRQMQLGRASASDYSEIRYRCRWPRR